MKVFILCAGSGTRMYPFTIYENKSLLRIGGYPIARIIADNMLNQKICSEADVNIICKPVDFKDFRHEFRDTSYRVMPIGSNVNSGSAGDFMSAFESYFKYRPGIEDGDPIMIHYGDVMTNVDYSLMLHYWLQKRDWIELLLVGNDNIRHDYSKILTRKFDETVSKFHEKPLIGYTSWTGIMIFPFYEDKGLYPFLRAKIDYHVKHTTPEVDFAYDVFPEFIEKETTLLYKNVEDNVVWHDMGNIRSYENLRKKFTESDKSPLDQRHY